ncbi:MAG: hypothetical protein JWO26_3485, partial [Rhodospirillales bacterium]|nr:hypothetical protein [Rhodospirillales bacterium]
MSGMALSEEEIIGLDVGSRASGIERII